MTDDRNDAHDGKQPPLAYVAGAIGLVLTLGLIGFVGREALLRDEARAPALSVEQTRVRPIAGNYLVEFDVKNGTSVTAAAVEVEAKLEIPGAEEATSNVTLDYVPGNSERHGGLLLPFDPARGKLEIRVMGYTKP